MGREEGEEEKSRQQKSCSDMAFVPIERGGGVLNEKSFTFGSFPQISVSTTHAHHVFKTCRATHLIVHISLSVDTLFSPVCRSET